MVERLTFKQYLESKKTLREAVEQTPKQTKTYTVNRYCNFVIGESKDDRQSVNLRPNSTITIDWLYEDIDNPTPFKVGFDGLRDSDPMDDLLPAWSSQKIQKWLIRNTTEESHI